jgi:predicted nuclease of predicted toxin-antitoxin system
MVVWIDAQLAPTLAGWLRDTFGVAAVSARELQLRDAEDAVIFRWARSAGAVVHTKDADFVTLVGRHGPPPHSIRGLGC